jgi:hypothetical protein
MSTAKPKQNESGQDKKCEIVSGSEILAQSIEIRPPADASQAPPVLSFRRKREIEIPWMNILSGGASVRGGTKSVEAIRSYFEKSWGFDDSGKLKNWMEASGKNKLSGSSRSIWNINDILNGALESEAKKLGVANDLWYSGALSERIKSIALSAQAISWHAAIAAGIKMTVDTGSRLRAAKYEASEVIKAASEAKAKGGEVAKIASPSPVLTKVANMLVSMATDLEKGKANPLDVLTALEKSAASAAQIGAEAALIPAAYSAQFDPKGTELPVDGEFIVRHGSGRMYRLISSPGTPLCDEDFASYAAYENAWENKIDGIEQVFATPEEARNCFMDLEEIDLQPPYIQRNYQRLKLKYDFANQVRDSVAERVKIVLKDTAISPEEIERLQNQVVKLEIGVFDIKRQIRRLTSVAERLGYFLCVDPLGDESRIDAKTLVVSEFDKTMRRLLEKGTEDASRLTDHSSASAAYIKLAEIEEARKKFATDADTRFKGPPVEPLAPGNIYTTCQRTAKWNVLVPTQISVQVGTWFWGHTVQKTVDVARPMEAVVTGHTLVDVSKDLVEAKRTELTKTGMQVHVFKKTPTGFVSEDGVPLHQIMDRCNFDEAFRRQCAVMLPVYRESMTGKRLLTKYLVFKRPLPGIVPTIMPRLSLEESLSYRTAWRETQLGEMVSSINLAPGEERQVKISKSFEQETTVTRTSNSIFDVTSTETTDLASEMENQSRHEQESSKSMEFSAKASGSYLGFSAEASASGGTKSSLKDMNQAISKVAKKAAQSVSSHNRQEVSSSSTARAKTTNVDETTATIRNINQGRSLNLFFYRLYNKFKGGLYLEDLRFDVIQSVEVIAGSGVHESRSYGLDQLPEMIAEFKSAHLPFVVSKTNLYTCHLLDSIETLLRDEYMNLTVFDSKELNPEFVPTPTGDKEPDEKQAEELAKQKLKHLRDALRAAVIHSNVPIAPQELLVAAPGLYLDAAVGAQPSTEPYSEKMRKQEIRMRKAEVFVKESEGFGNQAKAAAQMAQMLNETANCITGVLADPATNSLTLSLKLPLPAGDWVLVNKEGKGEEEKAQVGANSVGQYMIRFSWPAEQKREWLKNEALASQVTLVNKLSKDRIAHFSVLQIAGTRP